MHRPNNPFNPFVFSQHLSEDSRSVTSLAHDVHYCPLAKCPSPRLADPRLSRSLPSLVVVAPCSHCHNLALIRLMYSQQRTPFVVQLISAANRSRKQLLSIASAAEVEFLELDFGKRKGRRCS